MATNTYVELNSTTVTSATPSITFNSLSQNYTDLVLVLSSATTHSSATFPYMRFNSDSGSNYSYTEMSGNGSVRQSFRDINQPIGWLAPQNGSISTVVGENVCIAHIFDYSNTTTNKSYLSRIGRGTSSLDYYGDETAIGLWRNTGAITSITIGNRRGGVDYNFAVGTTVSLYGIKTWTAESTPKATGGAVFSDSNYWYHVFNYSGTFVPTQSLTCDYLAIAGGGAGGGDMAGGGGAGGLRSTVTATGGGGALETPLSLTTNTYTVTIGAGGAATIADSTTGSNGSNTSISGTGLTTITCTGGGGGGYYDVAGVGGGSGGGAGRTPSGGGGARTASPVQGNNGGGGSGSSGTTASAGGGGGAGAAGVAGSTSGAGAGGAGLALSAFATSTFTGVNTYYAGGGAGGAYDAAMASGGIGGGGDGGKSGVRNGQNAIYGTGSGGGGGGPAGGNGGAGGSGLVILRYAK